MNNIKLKILSMKKPPQREDYPNTNAWKMEIELYDQWKGVNTFLNPFNDKEVETQIVTKKDGSTYTRTKRDGIKENNLSYKPTKSSQEDSLRKG